MSGVVYASVDRLVEVLGLAGTLALARRFGGVRVYVPQPERLKPEGALVATLGHDIAHKLAFEFRGLEIMVPKCVAYLNRERARRIHAEAKTASAAQLATRYGITERYVFAILAEPPPDEPAEPAPGAAAQRSLFS